jgi:hypothetical protein
MEPVRLRPLGGEGVALPVALLVAVAVAVGVEVALPGHGEREGVAEDELLVTLPLPPPHAMPAVQPGGPRPNEDAFVHPSGRTSTPGTASPLHELALLGHVCSHRLVDEQLSTRVSTSTPLMPSGVHWLMAVVDTFHGAVQLAPAYSVTVAAALAALVGEGVGEGVAEDEELLVALPHAMLAVQPGGPRLFEDASTHPSGRPSVPGSALPLHDVEPGDHLKSHRVDDEQPTRRVYTSEPPTSSGLHWPMAAVDTSDCAVQLAPAYRATVALTVLVGEGVLEGDRVADGDGDSPRHCTLTVEPAGPSPNAAASEQPAGTVRGCPGDALHVPSLAGHTRSETLSHEHEETFACAHVPFTSSGLQREMTPAYTRVVLPHEALPAGVAAGAHSTTLAFRALALSGAGVAVFDRVAPCCAAEAVAQSAASASRVVRVMLAPVGSNTGAGNFPSRSPSLTRSVRVVHRARAPMKL